MLNINHFNILLLAISAADLHALKIGDSESKARAELGEPLATIKISDDKKICSYERGEVIFSRGKASSVNLISPEEFSRRKEVALRERNVRENQKQMEQARKQSEIEEKQRQENRARREAEVASARSDFKFYPIKENDVFKLEVVKLSIETEWRPGTVVASSLASIGGGGGVYATPDYPTACMITVVIRNNSEKPILSPLIGVVMQKVDGSEKQGYTIATNNRPILPNTVQQFQLRLNLPKGREDLKDMQDGVDEVLLTLYENNEIVQLNRSKWRSLALLPKDADAGK
jgi:hypothetical protein